MSKCELERKVNRQYVNNATSRGGVVEHSAPLLKQLLLLFLRTSHHRQQLKLGREKICSRARRCTISICSALCTVCTLSDIFVTVVNIAFSVMCTRYMSRATILCQSFAHLEKCVSSPMYRVHCNKHKVQFVPENLATRYTFFGRVLSVC